VELTIVETATMPTTGGRGQGVRGESWDPGVLWSYPLIPLAERNPVGNVPSRPTDIFVRFRPGTHVSFALRTLEHIAERLRWPTNCGVPVLAVQHAAEMSMAVR